MPSTYCCWPNGVGKTTIVQKIAHQTMIQGHNVLFTSAGELLGDLSTVDSDSALRRRPRHYTRPVPLVIDEAGYLSYSNRHPDLTFELISRHYQNESALVTPNVHSPDGARCSPTPPALGLVGRPPSSQRGASGWGQGHLKSVGGRGAAGLGQCVGDGIDDGRCGTDRSQFADAFDAKGVGLAGDGLIQFVVEGA